MTKNCWLIALLALPVMGSPLSVQVSTSALSGMSGELAFDFTDGGPPSNSAQISGFLTNGTLGTSSTTGSVTGTLASTVTLLDSSFFSEFLQGLTLGSSLSFVLNQTANPPAAGSSPDEFAFFLLNAAGTASLITTTDPTGADALFIVDSNGTSTGAITVYTSTQAGATVNPVMGSAPEPSSVWLLGIGAGLLVALRLWSDARLLMLRRRATWLASTALVAAMAPAMNAQYSFVKIADYGTPRPDGQQGGAFLAHSVPVTDGTYAIWAEQTDSSLWSNVIGTTIYTKLADTTTLAPGGTGDFTLIPNLNTSGSVLAISQGLVLFPAIDSRNTYPTAVDGLFTVPAAGGPVNLLANYTTADPNGGTFVNFGLSAGPSIASYNIIGSHVAFDATGSTGDGVFTALSNGTQIAKIIEPPTQCHPEFDFPVIIFGGAQTDGTNVVFYGQNVFDPSIGYDALYLNSCGNELVTSATQLPGNPNSNFHTRIYDNLIRMSNGVIAFVADDSNSSGSTYYKGIFTYSSGSLQKVVSTLDTVPGLGPLVGTDSFGGISFMNGSIVFHAEDATKDGLFLASGGAITKVIALGDPLDGGVTVGACCTAFLDPTPNALAPNGTIAFYANVSGKFYGMFAAIPACGSDVTSQVSLVPSGFRLNRATGLFTQTVTVTNISGSTIAGPLSLVLSNLTNGTLSGATGSTACDAPAGRPYINFAPGGLAPGANTTLVLNFSDPASQSITYNSSVVAGSSGR